MKLIIITIILVILVIATILAVIKQKNDKNKYELINIKIDEAFKNIEILLEKKDNLLEESINVIKNSNKKKYSKKEILEDLIKNKNKKLSIYEKFIESKKYLNEFISILEDDKKLETNKDLAKIRYDLETTENDLMASVNYYNKSVDVSNKSFSHHLINKNKKLEKFDNSKLEEFEILKENKNVEPTKSN